MKFKASYFSLSKAVILENLRRFWAIPAISFLIYFLSGVFPVLMQYDEASIRRSGDYISSMLANLHPFFIPLLGAIPVIAAVMVYRYLQQSASVTSMHAMPFSRAKLFNSSFLSGLIMSVLPMLLTGLILMCIAKPVYNLWEYDEIGRLAENAVNVFSRSAILGWMADSFVIILFMYAVSVFACVVTGNAIMSFMTSYFFNFLLMALGGLNTLFANMYLWGYDSDSTWLTYLNPIVRLIAMEGNVRWGLLLVYILISIAVAVVSSILYHRRKMERAGEAMAFNFMIPLISYLIALFGMTLMGMYFDVIGYSQWYMYFGFVIGAVIFFLIGRMIVLKTPRVFNMRTFRNFGIYSLIAVMLLSVYIFDLTGFEKRVPDPSKVEYVYTDAVRNITFERQRFEIGRFKPREEKVLPAEQNTAESPEYRNQYDSYIDEYNIADFINFHREIIERHQQYSNGFKSRITGMYTNDERDGKYIGKSLALSYYKGDKLLARRRYYVPMDLIMESQNLKNIYESKEFKEQFALSNLRYNVIKDIEVYNAATAKVSTVVKDVMGLLQALDKDFAVRTYEQEMDVSDKRLINVDISYGILQENGYVDQNVISVKLLSCDKNAISWLKTHGYGDVLETDDAQILSATVYANGIIGNFIDEGFSSSIYTEEKSSRPDDHISEYIEIGDKNQIKQLWDKGQGNYIESNFYEVTFNLQNDTSTLYSPEELEKKLETGAIDRYYYQKEIEKYYNTQAVTLFIPVDEAPDFLKELFFL